MRKILAFSFLLYLLIYQIVLHVVNREGRTTPAIEVTLQLQLHCGLVGKKRKLVAEALACVVFELVNVVGWVLKRNVLILENDCLVNVESGVGNGIHDLYFFRGIN